MILHPPFFISPRLMPAIKLGDATLSLAGVGPGDQYRAKAEFILDFPDGTEYRDDRMQSGHGGFTGMVSIFETFLAFLGACADSRDYEIRNRLKFGEGENSSLFPEFLADWAMENQDEIDMARFDLCDPEDGCTVRDDLIEEDCE